MDEADKGVLEVAKEHATEGYEKASEFCELRDCTPADLLRSLVYTPADYKPTACQILTDAGAILWCIEQLDSEQQS